MIEISASAQTYLQGLLANQDDEGVSIRIFVAQPGTPQAETCIAYCRPGEEQEGDIAVEYEGFRAWFEGRSEPYLEEAEVDYQEDQMGGQLTIKVFDIIMRPNHFFGFGMANAFDHRRVIFAV